MSTDSLTTKPRRARDGLRSKRLVRRLFLFSLLLLLASTLVQSYVSLRVFENELGPAVEAKAQTIGRSIAREIGRAVALNIPFTALNGMGEYLETARAGHAEIAYVIVADSQGRALYTAGDAAREVAAILAASAGGNSASASEDDLRAVPRGYRDTIVPLRDANGQSYGTIHLGIDEHYLIRTLRDVGIDILTVLLVTLLITFEVLVILAALGIVLPIRTVEHLMIDYESRRFDRRTDMRGRGELARLGATLDELGGRIAAAYAGLHDEHEKLRHVLRDHPAVAKAGEALRDVMSRFRLTRPEERQSLRIADFAHVRAPLVVFILTEELSRSFMPIYIDSLAMPIFGLSTAVVSSLPISFYMLLVAVSTPFAGSWVDRVGARTIFLAGTVPTVIGMIGTAYAQGVWDLLLWRGLAAIGYAMSTIAAQGFLSRVATGGQRVQGMAVYVGAVMVAAICGTAIGGMLADRIGFRATFLLSAAAAVVAAALAYHFLFDPPRDSKGAVITRPRLRDIGLLLGRPLFGALMLGVAVPAKIVLTGFLFYLMPLYLSGIGSSQSEIGRAMTVYFVLMAVGTKLVAPLADRVGKRRRFILFGGLVAGAGPLLLLLDHGLVPALVAAAAVGVGQALATSPLMALVTEVAARETPQVGNATVLSVFRVLERVGSVLGPFIAAGLAAVYGYGAAMASMGGIVLVGTAIFIIAFAWLGLRRGAEGNVAP